jgi:hypothetical protein
MKHKIDWSSAKVSGGDLTVSLTERRTQHSNVGMWSRWEEIFNRLMADGIMPGIEYSPSLMWGRPRVTNGVIVVDQVPDRALDSLHAHLTAAVVATNEEFEKEEARRVRQLAEHRQAQLEAAAQDQVLTDRFRQLANQ